MSPLKNSFYLCTIPSTEGSFKLKFRNNYNTNTHNTCNAMGVWPITCVCNETESSHPASKALGGINYIFAMHPRWQLPIRPLLPASCVLHNSYQEESPDQHTQIRPTSRLCSTLTFLWCLTKSPRYQQLLCWKPIRHRNQLFYHEGHQRKETALQQSIPHEGEPGVVLVTRFSGTQKLLC